MALYLKVMFDSDVCTTWMTGTCGRAAAHRSDPPSGWELQVSQGAQRGLFSMHASIRPPHCLFFLFRILLSVPNSICFPPLGEGIWKSLLKMAVCAWHAWNHAGEAAATRRHLSEIGTRIAPGEEHLVSRSSRILLRCFLYGSYIVIVVQYSGFRSLLFRQICSPWFICWLRSASRNDNLADFTVNSNNFLSSRRSPILIPDFWWRP